MLITYGTVRITFKWLSTQHFSYCCHCSVLIYTVQSVHIPTYICICAVNLICVEESPRHFYYEVRLYFHINCLVYTFPCSGRLRWGHNDRMSLSLRTVLLHSLLFILAAQFVFTQGGKVHVVLCESQPISRTGHDHTTSNLVIQNDIQLSVTVI